MPPVARCAGTACRNARLRRCPNSRCAPCCRTWVGVNECREHAPRAVAVLRDIADEVARRAPQFCRITLDWRGNVAWVCWQRVCLEIDEDGDLTVTSTHELYQPGLHCRLVQPCDAVEEVLRELTATFTQ